MLRPPHNPIDDFWLLEQLSFEMAANHPLTVSVVSKRWTGPLGADLVRAHDPSRLVRPVPGERWPYGPPSAHEVGCRLFAAGLFCDCMASAADDVGFGEGSWPTPYR